MTNNFQNLIELCREKINDGATREAVVTYLHGQGLNIIDSMKVMRKLYNLSLGEAKAQVTAHPVWADIVQSADGLHEELISVLEKESEKNLKHQQ